MSCKSNDQSLFDGRDGRWDSETSYGSIDILGVLCLDASSIPLLSFSARSENIAAGEP